MERPVLAILDFYGAKNFNHPFWTSEIPSLAEKLPPALAPDFMNQVYSEKPVPTWGGVSLEGQAAPGPPNFDDPRQAFAMTQIAKGTVLKTCYPSQDFQKIDPVLNVTRAFPPTFIVHGLADFMIPCDISSKPMLKALKAAGVRSDMVEIPGEPHTFVARMVKGSQTWEMQRRGFDFLQKIIEQEKS